MIYWTTDGLRVPDGLRLIAYKIWVTKEHWAYITCFVNQRSNKQRKDSCKVCKCKMIHICMIRIMCHYINICSKQIRYNRQSSLAHQRFSIPPNSCWHSFFLILCHRCKWEPGHLSILMKAPLFSLLLGLRPSVKKGVEMLSTFFAYGFIPGIILQKSLKWQGFCDPKLRKYSAG